MAKLAATVIEIAGIGAAQGQCVHDERENGSGNDEASEAREASLAEQQGGGQRGGGDGEDEIGGHAEAHGDGDPGPSNRAGLFGFEQCPCEERKGEGVTAGQREVFGDGRRPGCKRAKGEEGERIAEPAAAEPPDHRGVEKSRGEGGQSEGSEIPTERVQGELDEDGVEDVVVGIVVGQHIEPGFAGKIEGGEGFIGCDRCGNRAGGVPEPSRGERGEGERARQAVIEAHRASPRCAGRAVRPPECGVVVEFLDELRVADQDVSNAAALPIEDDVPA